MAMNFVEFFDFVTWALCCFNYLIIYIRNHYLVIKWEHVAERPPKGEKRGSWCLFLLLLHSNSYTIMVLNSLWLFLFAHSNWNIVCFRWLPFFLPVYRFLRTWFNFFLKVVYSFSSYFELFFAPSQWFLCFFVHRMRHSVLSQVQVWIVIQVLMSMLASWHLSFLLKVCPLHRVKAGLFDFCLLLLLIIYAYEYDKSCLLFLRIVVRIYIYLSTVCGIPEFLVW